MICSGVCRLPFMSSLLACNAGSRDSHKNWIKIWGAGQPGMFVPKMLLDSTTQVYGQANIVKPVVLVERVHAVLRSNEVGDLAVVLLERRDGNAFKESADKWSRLGHPLAPSLPLLGHGLPVGLAFFLAAPCRPIVGICGIRSVILGQLLHLD